MTKFIQFFFHLIDSELRTPLHLAASNGHLNIVELIMEENDTLDLEPKDKKEWRPIHDAAKGGHFDICQFIVTNGWIEDENPMDYKGRTPLHIAAFHGHFRICRLFVDNIEFIESKGMYDSLILAIF